MRAYYFGCGNGPGHVFFLPSGALADYRLLTEHTIPWKDQVDGGLLSVDGKHPLGEHQEQGRARVLHLEGWTALVFWDRSVDKRFGSNSGFYIEQPDLTFDQAWALAQELFPWACKRIGFAVQP